MVCLPGELRLAPHAPSPGWKALLLLLLLKLLLLLLVRRHNQELEQNSANMQQQNLQLEQEAQALALRLDAVMQDRFKPSTSGFDADTPIDKTLNFLQSCIAVSAPLLQIVP